ncbi:hypothetical protein PENSPDRAFT_656499 [Peniophora sp. CONT]|nr:hypothetical protein PENSPDRAFT_656499 [Peniophora sp. CONT]
MSVANTPTSKRNADYVLVDGPPEIRRLSSQYFYMKHFFDNADFLPSPIDINDVDNVLDVAAGTGVWTLDFADQPAAAARLPPHTHDRPLRLRICDISTAKFPPEDVLARAGIEAFQHDVLTPFPAELRGTIDLVNMNYLVYALTEDKWKIALKNVHDVLKPGGYLILRESDPVFYSASNPPPPDDGTPHDLPAHINGTAAVHKMNSILTGFAVKSGFVVGLSYRFPELLQSAGLITAHRKRLLLPTGDLCDTFPTARGSSMTPMKASSVENLDAVFDMLSKIWLDRGMLEVPAGTKIESEEGRQAVLKELHERAVEGVLVVQTEIVAQRPT